MFVDVVFGIVGAFGLACAIIVFLTSPLEPNPPGPWPFFGGLALFAICAIALIARVSVLL